MAPKAAPTKARGGKRVASVEADLDEPIEMDTPAPKRSKPDSMIDAVTESIQNMDSLSPNCRNMLAALAPCSLGTPAEERQELQVMAVQMIKAALTTQRASLQQAVVTEEATLAEIEASRKAVQSKVDEMEAASVENLAAVEDKKQLLNETSQDVLQARQILADAEETHEKEAKLIAEATGDRKDVEATLSDNFGPLKSGDLQIGQSKYHIDILAPLVKRVKLDESLATALPSSLTKKPAERGPFDRTVIEQLELGLKAKITEFTNFLGEADARSAAQVAAVDSARRAHDASKERQQQTAAELAIVTSTQREQAAALANAKVEAESYGPAHAMVTQARSDKENTLQAFETRALACFERMENGVELPATQPTAVPADPCSMVAQTSKLSDEAPEAPSPPPMAVGGQ